MLSHLTAALSLTPDTDMGNCCLVGRSGKVIFVRWGRSVTHAQATPGVLWGRSTTGTVTRSLYSAPVSRLMSGGEDEF